MLIRTNSHSFHTLVFARMPISVPELVHFRISSVELPIPARLRILVFVLTMRFFFEVARIGSAIDNTGHGSGVFLHNSQLFVRSDVA